MLEPDASKGARPVLRGGGAGDSTSLPDRREVGVVIESLFEADFTVVVGVVKAAWRRAFPDPPQDSGRTDSIEVVPRSQL